MKKTVNPTNLYVYERTYTNYIGFYMDNDIFETPCITKRKKEKQLCIPNKNTNQSAHT